jgi:hypothetical protein
LSSASSISLPSSVRSFSRVRLMRVSKTGASGVSPVTSAMER